MPRADHDADAAHQAEASRDGAMQARGGSRGDERLARDDVRVKFRVRIRGRVIRLGLDIEEGHLEDLVELSLRDGAAAVAVRGAEGLHEPVALRGPG